MRNELSPNTQAILLLTAPLIIGQERASARPLSVSEYKNFARRLRESQRQPADLLRPGSDEILQQCRQDLDGERLKLLLGRGFLLGQALERWQAKAIWVVSRADSSYPRSLKKRLADSAPPVLYGCGDASLLGSGGLAVVGSRNVNAGLLEETEAVGRLAAEMGCVLVSGGARGIDQAAMRGALQAGGRAIGVLADSLERTVLVRETRDVLRGGRLVLISPYDPAARFNVGHAMQRNKLIYALADAGLVMQADVGKGGTWTGAVEQLEKWRFVPIYVRAHGEASEGLEALRQRGAQDWPKPRTPDEFQWVLAALPDPKRNLTDREPERTAPTVPTPADELFTMVRRLLERMDIPKTDVEVAEDLQVSTSQVQAWLQRLVEEGVLEKLSRPIRYRATNTYGPLFHQRDRSS